MIAQTTCLSEEVSKLKMGDTDFLCPKIDLKCEACLIALCSNIIRLLDTLAP